MRFYFEALWKSADIRWLRERRDDFGRGSKYFLGLLLVLSLVYAIIISHSITRDIKEVMGKTISVAPELSFEKKDGKIIANGVNQPFMYDLNLEGQAFFIYIDTTTSSAAVSPKTFTETKKGALIAVITEDKIAMFDTKEETPYTIPAHELPENASVPYGKTAQHIYDLVQTPRFFAIIAAISLVVMFIVFTIVELLYLLIVVAIITGAVRIKKAPWTFGDIFTVSMFAVTLPLLIDEILPLFGLNTWYVGSIVLVGLLCAIVFYKPEEQMIKTDEKSGE